MGVKINVSPTTDGTTNVLGDRYVHSGSALIDAIKVPHVHGCIPVKVLFSTAALFMRVLVLKFKLSV